MKATVVDFRYKMPRVLRALRLRESVTLLYHGKVQGTLLPAKSTRRRSLAESPVFGMWRKNKRSVKKIMDALRGPRHRAH